MTLTIAGVLAACSTQDVPPATSTAPSTTSVTDKWNALELKAKSALAPKDAFGPSGPWKEDRPMTERRGAAEVLRLCGPVQVEPGWAVSQGRLWVGELVNVNQYVHALSDVHARDLVEKIRSTARTCPKHVPRDGKPERVVSPDADIPAPAGLDDFYAYCETANDPEPGVHHCLAALAHNDLLVTTSGWGYAEDFATARASALNQLRQAVPVVAGAVLAV
ncbi:hypothetical protein [Lentzea sp. NBRC 105346]|uniref:hypothetical protein n=1 Tax=Lentzea sp. NBRC 105346 TaxID=3032205 RepID=UPI00255651D9|nr:hypothetical protein [Lentzea sp. NBRC 105346]